jgi:hypothetical protein
MLVVPGALVQPLDDPAEAFGRHGARVPLQGVHAETSEADDKIVWRRPAVSARHESKEGVVDCLAAVLCVRVEEAVHQLGCPRYPREAPVQGSVDRLRRRRPDRLVETLPCEDVRLRHAAGPGQPGVQEGQTGLSLAKRWVSLAG